MGHFGFSNVGLIYLLMLFIPNAMWAKKQPAGYDPSGENKILLTHQEHQRDRKCNTACTSLYDIFTQEYIGHGGQTAIPALVEHLKA